ncbi:hypothetical protein JCM16303_007281 [Sporobolomyces ruberrimus]
MSLLQRAMGSISRDNDSTPTGPASDGNRRKSGGQGGARGSPYARPAGDSWKHDKYDDKPASAATTTAQPGSLASRLSSGSAPVAGTGRASAKTTRLVVKDLHYEVSERELETLFVQIGPLATPPKIKFDRSGRSTGLAWIHYTTEENAEKAKESFDGAPCKGQAIRIEYDYRSERAQPAPGSLLARLDSNPNAPRGPRNGPTPAVRGGRPHVGPQRGVGSTNPDTRPPRPPRGEGGGGRGGKVRREPKTNDDLDKELEAFMKSPETSDKPAAATTTSQAAAPVPAPAPVAEAPAPQAESGGDVEMS